MKLVDQWREIERRLARGWEAVALRVRPEQETDLPRAAQILGSTGAGRVGGERAVSGSRVGGGGGPDAARGAFERLDDQRVWCRLTHVGSLDETAPVTLPDEAPQAPSE